MVSMDALDKNAYYKKAEEILKEKNLNSFKIDKDRIGFLSRDMLIKIYFLPFSRKTVPNEELLRAKKVENIVITNDRFSKHRGGEPYPIRENGYMLLSFCEN